MVGEKRHSEQDLEQDLEQDHNDGSNHKKQHTSAVANTDANTNAQAATTSTKSASTDAVSNVVENVARSASEQSVPPENAVIGTANTEKEAVIGTKVDVVKDDTSSKDEGKSSKNSEANVDPQDSNIDPIFERTATPTESTAQAAEKTTESDSTANGKGKKSDKIEKQSSSLSSGRISIDANGEISAAGKKDIAAVKPISNETKNTEETEDPSEDTITKKKLTYLRKLNHKEVERRRRESINNAISELQLLISTDETNKAAIIRKACQYILDLKEKSINRVNKWTLEKIITDQAISELANSNEKLKSELEKAYREIELHRTEFENFAELLSKQGNSSEVTESLTKMKIMFKDNYDDDDDVDDEEEVVEVMPAATELQAPPQDQAEGQAQEEPQDQITAEHTQHEQAASTEISEPSQV